MKTEINIKAKTSLEDLAYYKRKRVIEVDVRFQNVHLKKINPLLPFDLFKKNDIFANADMLWQVMQPLGGKESHNYHNLSPQDIIGALNEVSTNPYCVLRIQSDRYIIGTEYVAETGEPLLMVIEIGAGLSLNQDANVNKMVTMYPKGKEDLDHKIENSKYKDVLYWRGKPKPIEEIEESQE